METLVLIAIFSNFGLLITHFVDEVRGPNPQFVGAYAKGVDSESMGIAQK